MNAAVDERLSAEQAAELFREGEAPGQEPSQREVNHVGSPQMSPVPATFHLRSGEVYECEGRKWAYTAIGLYGCGSFAIGDKPAPDILVPFENVAYIEFDFATFKEQLEAELKEQAGEGPSD